MPWSRPHPRRHSLAEIQPEQLFRIEHILFDMLKDLCHGLGIIEGDVLRCRRTSRSVVLLETLDGRTIILDADWARFVQVRVIYAAQRLLPVEPAVAESLASA
jgi:hypothetical protein